MSSCGGLPPKTVLPDPLAGFDEAAATSLPAIPPGKAVSDRDDDFLTVPADYMLPA